ncbi:MAG: twin-arginine translocation signal domain-containing protein [Acidimicrobiia bacterium]|nr:twin-arginine translocation signal domain-containing protein [Acidimicrobiia bacterium]MDH4309020.1 twin-arginine translocation signal domain-containing protein [Acidimicrobiia bacterium]
MSKTLVDRAGRFLEARTSRRGFLRRAAIVGSALAAAPAAYILKPGSAYSAVVRTPGNCPSGSRCADGGYTQFCCTLTGVNTCPPGSMIAGWWRAEGSGYCGGGSRYYMDCNTASCGTCGCGGSGTCSPECAGTSCRCANNNCSNWKVGCTRFRYGQCNQGVECLGPIECRVVTCVPPWEWDSSCTHTDAVDQNTRTHDATCLHAYDTGGNPVVLARPGVVTGASWTLRNSLTGGNAETSFSYGIPGDRPLMGDFSGSGIETPAVVRGTRHAVDGDETLTWYIRQVPESGLPDLVVKYGRIGDIPVVGDWNGNGVQTIGVVRGNRWLLRNANAPGAADIEFTFGQVGDTPIAGDWNGDGMDSPGMVRGTRWLLRNTATGGSAEIDITFDGGGTPVTGDWTGSGRDLPGWYDDGTWSLRNFWTSGGSSTSFSFGDPSGTPVVWGRVP